MFENCCEVYPNFRHVQYPPVKIFNPQRAGVQRSPRMTLCRIVFLAYASGSVRRHCAALHSGWYFFRRVVNCCCAVRAILQP